MGAFQKTHGEVVIVVEGAGRFPLDMLRYDSACPCSEGDSHTIEADGRRRVALRRFAKERKNGHEPRWQSFGWRIVWWGDRELFDAQRAELMSERRAV